MPKNPWDLARLQSYINAEEHAGLEFKSSKGLLDPKKIPKAVADLCADITGFLNGDGGLLIVGLDEGQRDRQPDIATKLSDGIPRSILSASQLENSICSHIHPSVAGLIKVFSIIVSGSQELPLLAFAVEITAGITAYQAPDKKYYVRRGFATEAMEDKDIRLRMLNNQVIRAKIEASVDNGSMIHNLKKIGAGNAHQGDAPLTIRVTNTGLKSITRIQMRGRLSFAADASPGHSLQDGVREPPPPIDYRLTWPDDEISRHVIHPEDMREICVGKVTIDKSYSKYPMRVIVNCTCYFEDSPAVTLSQDLTAAYFDGCGMLEQLGREVLPEQMKELVSLAAKSTSADLGP